MKTYYQKHETAKGRQLSPAMALEADRFAAQRRLEIYPGMTDSEIENQISTEAKKIREAQNAAEAERLTSPAEVARRRLAARRTAAKIAAKSLGKTNSQANAIAAAIV